MTSSSTTGGTGRTGRRIADHLRARHPGWPVGQVLDGRNSGVTGARSAKLTVDRR